LILLRRENRQVKLGRNFLKSQRYGSQRDSVMSREMIQAEAVVVDLLARRVVGWSMATHMRTERALGALNMALGRRRPVHKCIITVTDEANAQAMTMAMRSVPITWFAA
jgi:transposase InsO family protein